MKIPLMVQAIVGVVVAVPAALATEVRLRSSVACATSVVRLADVAELQGNDPRLTQALAETPLFPAPAAGQQRVLSQPELRQLLAASGVAPAAAVVTGSESVTILGEASDQARFLPRRSLVASGVRQAAFESAPEKINKPPVTPAPLPRPSSVNNSEVRSANLPQLVERGAAVTVHARTAGVRITSAAKALEAGNLGETISIELPDGKQRALARIAGPQVVEMGLSTNAAAPTGSALGSAAPQ